MAAGEPQRDEDLLEGWKAIADHLNKTERTVQRWEKTKALPVRRLKSDSSDEQGRVFAYKHELDAWWQEMLTRSDSVAEFAPEPVTPREKQASTLQRSATPTDDPTGQAQVRVSKNRYLRWIVLPLSAALMIALYFAVRKIVSNQNRPARARVTLAVRPFKDLGTDPSWDYVAAGLTEEMVTRLGQLHPEQMRVVRLTPGYADAAPLRLEKDLSADYVLEGSVRKVNDRVAITAQLIQVSNQSVVWGQSYERDLKDLLQVEDEVADAITGEALNKVPKAASPAREVNRQAYLAYLEGRYFWNKRTTDSLTRALSLFQKSIASDPSYAPSYAGLADCYELLGSAPYTALAPNQAFPQAEAAAKRALELDGSLAEAHLSLGYSEMVYEWNLPEARREFALAMQLRSEYATGHQFYGYYLTAVGDLQGAIAERRRAVELDPVNPLLSSALGEAYYQNREFDRAIEQNLHSLELDPSYAVALVNIGLAYEMKGMHSEARNAFQKVLAVAPDDPALLGLMGYEYASSGEKAQAMRILARLQQLSTHSYVPCIYIALVYIGLHDIDHAFQWLDRAADERSEYLVYIASEPLADPLRQDSRFPKLLHRVGLPPLTRASPASD